MALQKNKRSSRLVNPANWEMLFRRTSSRRANPGRRSLSKNSRAGFLVNPMGKTFMASFLRGLSRLRQLTGRVLDLLRLLLIGERQQFVSGEEQVVLLHAVQSQEPE